MTIWLKDFPQSAADFKALYALKQGIHGVFLLEEKFIPEDVDDYSLTGGNNALNLSPSALEIQAEEERKRVEERAKVEFTTEERLVAVNAALEIPRLLKQSAIDQDQKSLYNIQKLKFRGPDPPVTVTAQTGASTEPPVDGQASAVDPEVELQLEQVKEEERVIQTFSDELKTIVEQQSKDIQEFRILRKTKLLKAPLKPLWPYKDDDPELIKIREEEERRKKEEELLRKQEEERKQQELLAEQAKAAAPKGGKPGAAPAKAPAPAAPVQSMSTANLGENADRPSTSAPDASRAKKLATSKDEEEKEWNFQQLDQILGEITSQHSGIGGILAAMIY